MTRNKNCQKQGSVLSTQSHNSNLKCTYFLDGIVPKSRKIQSDGEINWEDGNYLKSALTGDGGGCTDIGGERNGIQKRGCKCLNRD